MLRLYQFAISHYCEKVRWALAYKGLDHEIRNLLPGPHLFQMRKLARRTSVPLLLHDGLAIQGSSAIISYLDETFPERSLTPEDESLAREAVEWERYLDEEVGVDVRRSCYHVLLERRPLVTSFFAHDGPWYARMLYAIIFPTLRKRMREYMEINERTARKSRDRLIEASARLGSAVQGCDYLVGDRFTRADLTAAALLAPLFLPAKYGLPRPARIPDEVSELADACRKATEWAERMYEKHR